MSRFHSTSLNILSLAAIQGANALLPLLIYPLVLVRLGPGPYGSIVQGEALSLILLVLVLYSFEVTGVIAVVRIDEKHRQENLSKLLSAILTIRVSLFLVGAPALVGVVTIVDADLTLPVLAWCLVPLSFALSPNFMLLALRDNVVLAVINVVSRAAAVILVIVLVTGPEHFLLVPVIVGVSYTIAAITALFVTIRKYRLSLFWVGWTRLVDMLMKGREVFLGNASTFLYRDSYLIILGLVGASSTAIATFSIAEKLTKAFQALIRPLNQHFFPQATSLALTNMPRRQMLRAMLRLSALQQAVLLALGVMAIVAYWLFGTMIPLGADAAALQAGITLFFAMSVATLFGVANFMLGTAGLNAMGKTRYVLFSQLVTGFACLLLGFVLIAQWQAAGAAFTFVIGEVLLFVLFVLGYMRRDLNPAASPIHPE